MYLFFTNILLQEQLLAEKGIPHLITSDINAMMTMFPSHQEITSGILSEMILPL
jgi:hypothetical protein